MIANQRLDILKQDLRTYTKIIGKETALKAFKYLVPNIKSFCTKPKAEYRNIDNWFTWDNTTEGFEFWIITNERIKWGVLYKKQ